jgi:hypothetical protein
MANAQKTTMAKNYYSLIRDTPTAARSDVFRIGNIDVVFLHVNNFFVNYWSQV